MHLPFKIFIDYPEKKQQLFLLDLPPFLCFERRRETNLQEEEEEEEREKKKHQITHAHGHASSDIGNRMDGCK